MILGLLKWWWEGVEMIYSGCLRFIGIEGGEGVPLRILSRQVETDLGLQITEQALTIIDDLVDNSGPTVSMPRAPSPMRSEVVER